MAQRHGQDRDTQAALLAAFVELERRKRRSARQAESDNPYARLVEHYERRGERLRGEKLVMEELTERLVQGVAKATPLPAQQELQLVGVPGGMAAGRFRVHNSTDQPVRVECVHGEAIDSTTPPIRFEPRAFGLPPNDRALVRVQVDLASFKEPSVVTVPIECWTGHRRDRLWLVVAIRSERGAQR